MQALFFQLDYGPGSAFSDDSSDASSLVLSPDNAGSENEPILRQIEMESSAAEFYEANEESEQEPDQEESTAAIGHIDKVNQQKFNQDESSVDVDHADEMNQPELNQDESAAIIDHTNEGNQHGLNQEDLATDDNIHEGGLLEHELEEHEGLLSKSERGEEADKEEEGGIDYSQWARIPLRDQTPRYLEKLHIMHDCAHIQRILHVIERGHWC
jgi:hypothetical protein